MSTERASLVNHQGRKTANIIVNARFYIQQHSADLGTWLGLTVPSWVQQPLTAVLPELTNHEAELSAALDAPEALFTLSIYRTIGLTLHTFNLQIEPADMLKSSYLVTLTDVTASPETAVGVGDNHLQNLQAQNRLLNLLNHAGRIVTATLETERVLERILQVTTQIINAAGSSVWLLEESQPDWLVCRAAYFAGNNSDNLLGQRLQRGQGIAGWVAKMGQGALVPDVQKDGRFYPNVDAHSGFTTHSLIAVPLLLRRQVIGVLEVVNKLDAPLTINDLIVAETIAASAVTAFENARLVEALQNRMDDLQAQNEELDAFDHTVAHDLQNPLSLILGFADLLQEPRNSQISEQDRQNAIAMIATSAHKMSAIVHELLLLSSVRKSAVETKPLAMGEIVDAALMRLSQMFDAHEATIALPESWPTAVGHAAWIEEVWENYISNAIKYGGKPPHVVLGATLMPSQRMVHFWVQDNGQGLSTADQARLFTPFTRLNDIRVNGQGLGLSIVHRIMHKLDGDVSVESLPGQGSTFGFLLPLAADQ